jgi:hypothetical protein
MLVALAFVVASVILWRAAFRPTDEVGRSAAVSTIWLVIPLMVAGIVMLALLGSMIFLAWKVTSAIPRYSLKTQIFFDRVARGTRRLADMVQKPVLAVRGLGALLKHRLQRLPERK